MHPPSSPSAYSNPPLLTLLALLAFLLSLSPLSKLLRVFRGSRYLKKLSSTLSTQFNPSLFRFVNALAFLITAWHFIACFYWGMVGFEYVCYGCAREILGEGGGGRVCV